MDTPVQAAPTWKRVLASILDFLTIFIIGGIAIGKATGETTQGGFNLSGVPALVLFVVIIAYFYVGRRHAGGTIWDRIFGIRRPQPN